MADVQCRGYAGSVPVYCSHDKIVSIGDVKPNPKNPNQHPENQIEMLAKIITTHGWRAPVTVSTRSGFVVRGHGRLMAAKFAGLDFVPVDFQHYESNDAELADLLADNKIAELSEIDNKLLADVFADIDLDCLDVGLTGYSEKEYKGITKALEKAAGVAELKDQDAEIEPPKTLTTKPGDLWRLGRHRLMCGDSTDESKVKNLFNGVQPYCIVTDPPYCSGGFQEAGKGAGSIGSVQGKKIKIANDTLSTRGYMSLMKSVLSAAGAVGCAYMFTDWRMWINLFDVAEASGYGVKSMIVWNKGTAGMGLGWRAQHELCMFASRSVQKFDPKKGSGNVITCSRSGNALHPTQKPVELIAEILKVTDYATEIYDPFGGSGTTLIACEQMERTCYLMELEPKYCDVIVRRYMQVTGKQDVVLVRDGEEIPVNQTGILND